MKWTTGKKIAVTILLAVTAWWIWGCGEPTRPPAPEPLTNIPYLERAFQIYNGAYFDGKLVQPEIVFAENPRKMATTMCDDGHCILEFNYKYVLAPRTADLTMLHEMCHMKTWGMDDLEHGKVWRTCMLQLDTLGAFRELIIDNYREVQP